MSYKSLEEEIEAAKDILLGMNDDKEITETQFKKAKIYWRQVLKENPDDGEEGFPLDSAYGDVLFRKLLIRIPNTTEI